MLTSLRNYRTIQEVGTQGICAMVKVSDVNKDICAISAKAGVAVFCYDDIHNASVNNEFHYDYQKVIDEVARLENISKEEAEKDLFKKGVLTPLPNGEYKVEVQDEIFDGVNYGSVFFVNQSKDCELKYHELAHSLQKKYGLFAEDAIDRVYEKVTMDMSLAQKRSKEKGLTEVSRDEYVTYLKEMHAESFAYAAMMLRAENKVDLVWQQARAYGEAVLKQTRAFLSFGKTKYGENSAKFYASLPVIKHTVKRMRRTHKIGKTGQFFEKDGVLQDEALARFCEDIVLREAYSPRTLKSFFEYRMLKNPHIKERGWKRDVFKAALLTGPALMISLPENGVVESIKNRRKHKALYRLEKQNIEKYVEADIQTISSEMRALKAYEKLLIVLSQSGNKQFENYVRLHCSDILQNGEMPKSVIRYKTDIDFLSQKERAALSSLFEQAGKVVSQNADNPYFKKLVESTCDFMTTKNLIERKKQNPQVEVIDAANLEKKSRMKESPKSAIDEQISQINTFLQDHPNERPQLQTVLTDVLVRYGSKIYDDALLGKLLQNIKPKGDFLGLKKKKLDKDFGRLIDSLSDVYFRHSSDEAYLALLQQMKGISGASIDFEKIKQKQNKPDALTVQSRQVVEKLRGINRTAKGDASAEVSPEISKNNVHADVAVSQAAQNQDEGR